MSYVPKHKPLERADRRSPNFMFFSWARSTSQRDKTIQIRLRCFKNNRTSWEEV